MIRAVLDSNTVVSGTIAPLGFSARILAAARSQEFEVISSADMVSETMRTLRTDRIQRKYNLTAGQIEGVRILLEQKADLTPLSQQVEGVATHPEDDLILAAAASGHADYLVTGDDKLQKLGTFEGVNIVSPRQFVSILESPEPELPMT